MRSLEALSLSEVRRAVDRGAAALQEYFVECLPFPPTQ